MLSRVILAVCANPAFWSFFFVSVRRGLFSFFRWHSKTVFLLDIFSFFSSSFFILSLEPLSPCSKTFTISSL